MISHLRSLPYVLPLRRSWGSARGGFEHRRGWLLQVAAEGLYGHGDCAPLPAAGTETPEAAWSALQLIESRARGHVVDTLLADLEQALTATPATRFALECALLDLTSRRQHLTLRRHLSPEARDEVAVNAMLGTLGTLTPADLQSACEAGFKVLKIKVGLDDPTHERDRLLELTRRLPPDIGLRLDANGAWDLGAARFMLDGLAGLPIESIEEPLRHPDPRTLATLQASTPFSLALDESLAAFGADLDPAALGVRRLVLKPAVIGGLDRTRSLARRAMAAGIEVVVTSLVESAAGLWPTTQLAAAIGATLPQGLATASWLAEDLGPAPQPRRGRISLPQASGSGFEPKDTTAV